MLRNYRDLRVWKLGIELVEDVYRITRAFPKNEVYGLAGQMQRAAVSVPSNVAEGYTRRHRKEYIQDVSVARASLAELDTQLEIAIRLKYIGEEENRMIRDQMESLSKQLYALSRALSDQIGSG